MLHTRFLLPMLFSALLHSCSEPLSTTDAQAAPVETRPMAIDAEADSSAPAIPQEDRSTVPFDVNGPRYTWSIMPAANGTYGFAIYDRGKLYIDQQIATGLSEPIGWKQKIDARTAAVAALEKLEKGEVPEGLNVVGK